jgi:ATP-dependent Clp endopeptidase proteolytic subunit ClpP
VAENTEKAKRSPSKLDQLRDAERRLREAEIALVEEKTLNVRLDNAYEHFSSKQHEFDYQVGLAEDSRNRAYTYSDGVNWNSIGRAMNVIGAWARMSTDPIVVRFSSPGGSIFDGFALYDQLKAIDSHRARITTVDIGWAASMAGILMQAGSRRIMAENASFMVHEASTMTWGKTSDIEDEAKLMRKINDRLFKILSDRSQQAFKAGTAKEGLTFEQVGEKAKRRDWWLDSAEALYCGFVDEIGYV